MQSCERMADSGCLGLDPRKHQAAATAGVFIGFEKVFFGKVSPRIA